MPGCATDVEALLGPGALKLGNAGPTPCGPAPEAGRRRPQRPPAPCRAQPVGGTAEEMAMAESDFEAPLRELQKQIDELARFPGDPAKDREANRLRRELEQKRREVYASLTPWQKTLSARTEPSLPARLRAAPLHRVHRAPRRPPLRRRSRHRVRLRALQGPSVASSATRRAATRSRRSIATSVMPKPEGYRKALRVMQLAAKFQRPIITFVDTPGAYPGIDAEERGQAEAIAYNLREMARITCPSS
jgi:acetyl-CoA carboxylase carboxyl transferase subunit alpha